MIAPAIRDQPTERASSIWWAVAFSTLAGGLALASSLVRPVWHDELYTLWLARMPLADLFAALEVDSGPPLHYLICHVLFSIVGWPEGSALGTLMVRLPSVAAFALMPWVLWRWGRGRREVFVWATALTMAWLPMLYFATEARAYALLALVNAALWLLGPDLIRSGGARVGLFAALAAALPMLHYAGIVSFCFLPCLALFIPRSRWRSLAAALGAAALPLLAWSPIILGAPNASMGWVDTVAGPGRPGFATLQVLAPAGPFPALFEAAGSRVTPWVSLATLLLLVGGCAVGAAKFGLRYKSTRDLLTNFGQPACGLLAFFALATLAVCGLPVYFAGRTESLVWLLGAGLSATAAAVLPRGWRFLVLGPYVVIGLVTIGAWLADLPDRPLPPGVEAGRALAPEIRDGDLVVVAGLWQLEIEHGLASAGLREQNGARPPARVKTIPESQSLHPGWLDVAAVVSPALLEEARALEIEARRLRSRIWLVWSPSLPLEANLLPAFGGWRRDSVAGSAVIAVDLLTLRPFEMPSTKESDAVKLEARGEGTRNAAH